MCDIKLCSINAKMQVQALTVNYKPFNESTKKNQPKQVSKSKGSKRAEVKAAGEQK